MKKKRKLFFFLSDKKDYFRLYLISYKKNLIQYLFFGGAIFQTKKESFGNRLKNVKIALTFYL